MSGPRLETQRYMNPYLAGVLLGLVLFAALFVTGHGLGASGAMSRVVAVAEDQVAPGHVDHRPYVASFARPDNPLDNWLIWMALGVVLGAVLSGWLAGRLYPEIHKGPGISVGLRLGAAFVGGMLMGYGSQWGRGCTSGQALSGGAVLSVGSWAFMFSVFGGAYALAYPLRRLWR
jgi:hypothetical protein